MKLLFATTHIHFPQGGGGGERNTHELSLALLDHGITPGVLCALTPDRTWLSYRNRLLRFLHRDRRFPEDRVCGYPVYRGWLEDGIPEVTRRFGPNAVIVQSTAPADMLRSLARIGVPAAVYVHEVVELEHFRGLEQIPFIANSEFTAGRLLERLGLSAVVIPPIVHPELYRTACNPRRVLFVNTVPRKGLEVAFALARARPDIPFDFIESWILTTDERAALAQRAASLGNVRLHPPTTDMRRHYANAKIALVPSQCEESWGRVATEAHVNGIPVLGSRCGGLPEAIGPGGMTVPPQAALDDWSSALSEMWDRNEVHQALSREALSYSLRAGIQPSAIAGRFAAFAADLAARDLRRESTEARHSEAAGMPFARGP